MAGFQLRSAKCVIYFIRPRYSLLFLSCFTITDFYRVIYDEKNYELIVDPQNFGRFSDNQKAQLLDDAFVLAAAHMLPYKVPLKLASGLKKEQRYVPWHAVLEEFDYIDNMLYSQPQYPDWKVRKLHSYIIINH